MKSREDTVILFVEDDPVTSNVFVKVLRRKFKNVYGATDGREGLEAFKKYKPDIVLTDLLMPRLNGIDMILRIRENSPKTPIIVMSAINEAVYLEKAKNIGIDNYLIKPIDEKTFYEVLNNVINALANPE